MTQVETRPVPAAEGTTIYVQWGPVIAGAIAMAALATVLHSFAAGVGLALISPVPTWRDASIALVLLTGLYLILVAIAAYGLGGYVAGRLRTRLTAASAEEVEFRDGTHGLLVWALGTLLTVLLAFAATQAITRLAAPGGGAAGSASSVAGENIIAFDLDRLFRGERRAEGDVSAIRAEAARILLTTAGHRGMSTDDRGYLVRLVSARTGLAAPEAERRVDDVAARARQNIRRARASAVIIAFSAGAAAVLGAVIAWFAACAGGRIRDGAETPSMIWDWGRSTRRI